MTKKITVYTTATCGYCHMLKDYLEANKIEFKEKRVDLDQSAAQEMIGLSGQMGVPFTIIKDEKGQKQGILGFDIASISSALN